MSNRRDPIPAWEFWVERSGDATQDDESLGGLDDFLWENQQQSFADFVRDNLKPAGQEPSGVAKGPAFVYLFCRSDLERAWQAVAHLLRVN